MLLPERQVTLARKLVEAREDRHVARIAGTLAAIPLDPAAPPNPEAYRARAEELTPDDAPPELRARIALLADTAQRHATKYWQHDRNQAGLAAIDWIVSNPGTPMVTMDRKIAGELSPEQRLRLQEIETTGHLNTDPDVYDKLDRMAVYDPKTFATSDLSQYRLVLDGKDYVRFTGFQNGDAAFARDDRGRTVLDAGLITAGFDPDDTEARKARGELDKTLGSFESIEGRPPVMADIDRIASDIAMQKVNTRLPNVKVSDELDGAAGNDELVGGAEKVAQADPTVISPEEKHRIEPAHDPARAQLPKDVKSDKPWRIEVRYHPILHRGHAFLVLVGPNEKGRDEDKAEMHGLSRSRNGGKIVSMGMDGADLIVQHRTRPFFEDDDFKTIGTVASGSYEDIVAGKWNAGQKAAIAINNGNFDYKAHDPAFEFGGGGQIQNSNSVAFTLGRAMGVDLEGVSRDTGNGRRFSGSDRNLLDPSYERYVVPSMFGGVPYAP